jgi:hypothetical protein
MAKTNTQLRDISKILEKSSDSFQDPPLISAPNTQILGLDGQPRKLPDPSKTLKPTFGIERIAFNSIVQVDDEKDTNGKRVYKLGSRDPRIRFVGDWESRSLTSGAVFGAGVSSDLGNYFEITFYGTGLNFLSINHGGALDWRVSVDGGAYSSNVLPSQSAILGSRNYAPNIVVPLVSGLSLGIHTVRFEKFDTISGFAMQGIEILNEEADIQVPQGEVLSKGRAYIQNALATTPYNSGFDGAPTLNGRGGRVLVYKEPGSEEVKKAIQQVDASQGNLGAADHSNEEVYRRINFREFGANRSDDFSTLTSVTSDRAFTLDDGTTTLVGGNVRVNIDGVFTDGGAGNATITLSFVGTGLDIFYGTMSDINVNHTIFIDGVQVGGANPLNGDKAFTIAKIVSGLPYGTHTFQLRSSNIGFHAVISDFIIYQPKKPSIPQDAEVISDYNLMADYSFDNSPGTDDHSPGVLGKAHSREMIYVGSGWALPINATRRYGGQGQTSTDNDYVEYTFFGTGVEYCFNANSASDALIEVTVDGISDIAGEGWSSGLTTNAGISFNSSTGILDASGDNDGARLAIYDLPLGLHTIRVTASASASAMRVQGFEIITPVHSPNTKVGSLSLGGEIPVLQQSEESAVDLGKAKALLIFDQQNNTIRFSKNISAVVDLAVGVHNVYFEKPFKDDPVFLLSVTGSSVGSNAGFINTANLPDGNGNITSSVRSAVRIQSRLSTNGPVATYDSNYVCLAVYGELEGEGE